MSRTKLTKPFEVVHSDFWGPSPTVSIEGYKYYFTIIDEYIRYTWIFPLRNKKEVLPLFQTFCALILYHYSASVKIFQSDGGGEFTSNLFKAFLNKDDIVH